MPNSTHDLLQKIIKQEEITDKFGFYWESIEQLLTQIQSECAEVKEAWLNQNKVDLKEEVGDLINATISLCIFLKFDPFETLNESVEKFQQRYDSLVQLVNQDGLPHLKKQILGCFTELLEQGKKMDEKDRL